jgi:bifunctional DNA-binding transcriptional regulator/antitoxin component of YhaV-PrlF toxin-antitoxin module
MANDNPKRNLPPPTQVKNRRLKVSPGGIVTLPVAARKALGLAKGQGARVTVAVSDGIVSLTTTGDNGGFRVSPGGQLELRAEARAALDRGTKRHYWIELLDKKSSVRLHPYQ